MKVLFLNDTALISGAERCLLDLLDVLDGEAEPLVVCPRGPLFDAVTAMDVPVVPTTPVSGSLRLHPLHTPRAVAGLGAAAIRVRHLAARHDIDLIHANTLRSCLIAAGARHLGAPPYAAFVHDALPDRGAARMAGQVVREGAAVIFANSVYSADRFALPSADARRRVVCNPIDLATFDPKRHTRTAARERLGLHPNVLVLAVVAQITPWKGQREALETFDALLEEHGDAQLLVVGDTKFVATATRYDNRAYLAELHAIVRRRRLERHVSWLGEREDVAAVLAATDILLVPSWEEPFGRIVVEGMAMGCLVAATAVGGPAEVMTDGVDGLLLAPREPASWARRIGEVLAEPSRAEAMRAAARHTAAGYGRERFLSQILEGYAAALG